LICGSFGFDQNRIYVLLYCQYAVTKSATVTITARHWCDLRFYYRTELSPGLQFMSCPLRHFCPAVASCTFAFEVVS